MPAQSASSAGRAARWRPDSGYEKVATLTQQNANPHLNPQAKVPYPPTTAATPNVKVGNVAKQVSDVDDNYSALAQTIQSQRVPTLPTKNALLAQKKGITAFKRA
jgi:hypothetical protein